MQGVENCNAVVVQLGEGREVATQTKEFINPAVHDTLKQKLDLDITVYCVKVLKFDFITDVH